MHQSWILSCLGSIGKRKKKIEGKVKTAYEKIIQPLNSSPGPPTLNIESDSIHKKSIANVPKKKKGKHYQNCTKQKKKCKKRKQFKRKQASKSK